MKHSAFRHTSHALVEVTRYCIEELGFSYVLLGKFQTDCLEDSFGKYRQLSGAQYHVYIRQIYESEHKLRLQKVLELPELPQLDVLTPCGSVNDPQDLKHFDVALTEQDVAKKQPMLPAITYVAGYCAHAATKKLACTGSHRSKRSTGAVAELHRCAACGRRREPRSAGLRVCSHCPRRPI